MHSPYALIGHLLQYIVITCKIHLPVISENYAKAKFRILSNHDMFHWHTHAHYAGARPNRKTVIALTLQQQSSGEMTPKKCLYHVSLVMLITCSAVWEVRLSSVYQTQETLMNQQPCIYLFNTLSSLSTHKHIQELCSKITPNDYLTVTF